MNNYDTVEIAIGTGRNFETAEVSLKELRKELRDIENKMHYYNGTVTQAWDGQSVPGTYWVGEKYIYEYPTRSEKFSYRSIPKEYIHRLLRREI